MAEQAHEWLTHHWGPRKRGNTLATFDPAKRPSERNLGHKRLFVHPLVKRFFSPRPWERVGSVACGGALGEVLGAERRPWRCGVTPRGQGMPFSLGTFPPLGLLCPGFSMFSFWHAPCTHLPWTN